MSAPVNSDLPTMTTLQTTSLLPLFSWATPILPHNIRTPLPHFISSFRPKSLPSYPPFPSSSLFPSIPTCTATHNNAVAQSSTNQTIAAHKVELGLQTAAETTTPLTLDVIGSLPPYLAHGAYYRNGPGVFEVTHKDGQPYIPDHWCDGMAMVQAFHFQPENSRLAVRLQSRTIAQGTIRAIQSVPKKDYVGVSVSCRYKPEPWLATLRSLLLPLTKDPHTGQVPYNNAVTLEFLPGKGHLNARTDANSILSIHPQNLRVLEAFDFSHFSSELCGAVSCAHGAYDESTGEYFNFTYKPGLGKVDYNVFRIGPAGRGEVISTFKDYPYYLHSFALTEHYVIMVMWPCLVDYLQILRHRSFLDALQMKDDTPTHFVVICRATNNVVATYQHDPFFSFHVFAAYEKGDDIVLHMPHYKDASVFANLRMDAIQDGPDAGGCIPVQYTLRNVSEAAAQDLSFRPRADFLKLANFPFELASISPDRQRKPYRYAYGVTDAGWASVCGVITKLDTQYGQHVTWTARNSFVGEPVFVRDPNGSKEDDGCLLVLSLDAAEERSFLAVLDARNMKEIARAIVPRPLPHGLHGTFVPNMEPEQDGTWWKPEDRNAQF